ncbi:MAG TPA: DUF6519 domain-containing protein [Candidatus Limnocylindrales bacterium]|nr:DUF6519 domain-containing protein [Candidatus Limnocylindrales bacterium]
MSADYSRWPVRTRDFAQVRLEQGRVLTDADWNEQALLAVRRERLETIDGLGRAVVPTATEHAFEITSVAGDLEIGVGRAYVDGLLVENHGKPAQFDAVLEERSPVGPVNYATQPWFRNPPPLPGAPYAAYLKVWQRERTSVEDPGLIEPALGVDTSARLQTVWQVLAVSAPAGATCDDIDGLIAGVEPAAAGRLTTSTAVVPGQPDPCRVVPGGGYTGLENQLYRIEIHDEGVVGGAGGATFKWSRDNGTVAARVESIGQARDRIVVDSLGRDDVLGFHDGDWIEITDDDHELARTPGELRRIRIGGGVDQATRTILLSSPLPAAAQAFPVDGQFRTLPERNTRVRRWDQAGKVLNGTGGTLKDLDAAGSNGVIAVPASNISVLLEHGIVVKFSTEGQGRFRTGDFWIFAARTADASVEELVAAPPVGIHAHFAPLAIVGPNPSDCRTVIPPLAELETLVYLGGDGQEATPSYSAPAAIALPVPVSVGVVRGSIPVKNRMVRFTVVDWPNAGSVPGMVNDRAEVVTGVDGTVNLIWTLGWDGRDSQKKQELVAQLLDSAGNPVGVPIRFSARLRTADVVAYDPKDCPDLAGAETVQDALDALCARDSGEGCCVVVQPTDKLAPAILESAERGNGHACLCLMPGVYNLTDADELEIEDILTKILSLTIGGRGAQLIIASPLKITGLQALDLREIQIVNATDQLEVVLDIYRCGSVTLDGIEADLTAGPRDSRVIRLTSGDPAVTPPTIRIRNCRIEHGRRSHKPRRDELEVELPAIVREMVALSRSGASADDTAEEFRALMDRPTLEREADAGALEELALTRATDLDLTTKRAINRISNAIREGAPLPLSRLTNLFERARIVGDRFDRENDAGTAIEIVDGRSDVWLDDNQLGGKVVLYGAGPSPDSEDRLFELLSGVDWIRVDAGGPPDLEPGTARLRVTNNILARITVGDDGVDRIRRYFETRQPPRNVLFDSIVLEGNDFSSPRQGIVGQLVSLASNTIRGKRNSAMGFAFGNVATLTGNIGTGGDFLMAAWESADAANRRMKIFPIAHP